MRSKGGTGNLGDPKHFPERGISSANSERRGEGADDASGVGSVHSRGNSRRKLAEALSAPHLADVLARRALEGTGKHSERCKETSSTLGSGKEMETALQRIARVAQADKRYKFRALASLLDEEYLSECFAQLKHGKAAGVDGIDAERYGENLPANLSNLVERMKKGSYKPRPVRRVYIPKESGGRRPLGIPSLEDKIVQMGITRILEAMFEPNFLSVSHGFRRGRSCHTALAALDTAIKAKPVNYVVDADIKGFFDNVDHKWMVECLKQRVADKNFLRLVVRFLKAGIMEEGKYFETERGTPQGGILSPVLSNIYLHYVLDLWLEKKLKRECKGHVEEIRYCDDFVICVELETDGKKVVEALRERLKKFGLSLSEEKTRLIGFGMFEEHRARRHGRRPATFDFLGFTHYCSKSKRGRFKVGRKTSKKKFRQKVREMNGWLKRIRNAMSIAEIWELLKVKMEGHYRYYGVSDNLRATQAYRFRVVHLLYKWLNRRSQRRSFSWKEFLEYLERYPLPRPKLYHNLYAMRGVL